MSESEKLALARSLRGALAIASDPVFQAFRFADRADFVLPEYGPEAYADYPLSIGYGQTVSQPSTVAFMLELLSARPGDRVLDVGSGSGWTTALLSHIVGPSGSVTGLEIVPELVRFGRANLAKYPLRNVRILPARKDVVGIPSERFDRILVSASASEFPEGLTDQLAPGGKLVIPVRGSVWSVSKDSDGAVRAEEFPGFVFVPLR